MSEEDVQVLRLSQAEEMELYIMLRRHEPRLPEELEAVRDRLERLLYERMSIADMEMLEARVRGE
tara:strand:+ start:988 stop:1182 length:195 start_codon:yes stop_codon:yes gene_type:complete